MYSPLIDILFGDFIISKKYIYGIFIFIELTLTINSDLEKEASVLTINVGHTFGEKVYIKRCKRISKQ